MLRDRTPVSVEQFFDELCITGIYPVTVLPLNDGWEEGQTLPGLLLNIFEDANLVPGLCSDSDEREGVPPLKFWFVLADTRLSVIKIFPQNVLPTIEYLKREFGPGEYSVWVKSHRFKSYQVATRLENCPWNTDLENAFLLTIN